MSVAPEVRRPLLADRPDKADKRDAILRAAIETFAARGFFNAQVADVARTARVAAGTVYLYFRGKDDLLISIFERTMKEAIETGRRSLEGRAQPLDRLLEIARLHL
jgi:TetR/AcrR family fatty acid metabolism transcriptional regulator